MKKNLLASLLLVALLLISSAALATVYKFDVSYGTLGYVDVDYAAEGFDDAETANVSDFNITSQDVSLDLSKAGYCVDLIHHISKGTYFGVLLDVNTLHSDQFGNARSYTEAATLIEHYGQSFDSNTDNLEEQIQLSIWESIHENPNNSLNLSSGDFQSDDYNFLTLGTGYDITNYRILRFTDANGNFSGKQDLIVKINKRGGGNVPIPGAIWLLGSGLFGLLGIRRRKQKQV